MPKPAYSALRAMLRVIVESASNIPKTKFGKPDPIVSVIFKGKEKFSSFSQVLSWNVSFPESRSFKVCVETTGEAKFLLL